MEENEVKKKYNISCCSSYLTPKGRCYTCPELDDDGSTETEDSAPIEKDPDQEKW